MNTAFHPGKVWLDTKGERIQAHGGSIFYLDNTYYWYGENKEFTDEEKGIWHWGVRCYVRTVASLLGHAQASTTLDIYAHAFDKNKRKAQEKLGKAIGL